MAAKGRPRGARLLALAAGVTPAIVLLGCAVWAWRRPGESAEPPAS
jgi:hypothetical protein